MGDGGFVKTMASLLPREARIDVGSSVGDSLVGLLDRMNTQAGDNAVAQIAS